MTRNTTVYLVGLTAGVLHMFAYQALSPHSAGLKFCVGMVLIYIGLFVARKVP